MRRTRGGPCRTPPAPTRRTERGNLLVSFTDTSLPQVSNSSTAVSRTRSATRSGAPPSASAVAAASAASAPLPAVASPSAPASATDPSTGPATSATDVAPPAASTAMRLSSTRPRLFTTTTFAGSYLPSAAACIAASMMTAAPSLACMAATAARRSSLSSGFFDSSAAVGTHGSAGAATDAALGGHGQVVAFHENGTRRTRLGAATAGSVAIAHHHAPARLHGQRLALKLLEKSQNVVHGYPPSVG